MTLPDFPDWAQPVAAIERDDAVVPLQNVPDLGIIGPFDVAALASVEIAVQDRAAATGVRCQLQVIWNAAGVQVAQDSISFHSTESYQSFTGFVVARLPVQGSQLYLVARSSDGLGLAVQVEGSSRSMDGERRNILPDAQSGRCLLDTGATAVAAGATSAVFYTPPVGRAVNLRFSSGTISPAHVTADGVAVLAGVLSTSPFAEYPLPTTYNVSMVTDLPAPGVGVEWKMTNTDTVSRNLRLAVWDVS
jgi:hypothetical protein